MKCLDSRRLTGSNLQTSGPGAIAEVVFEAHESPEEMVRAWRVALTAIAERLPFPIAVAEPRFFDGGAALVCSAPIDALYASSEASDWAIEAANSRHHGTPAIAIDDALERVLEEYADEVCPAMLELQAEAQRRGVPFLWDDDEVSMGEGRFSQTWARNALPAADEVLWDSLRAIPTVLITGTNGKTTTARLVSRMVQEAGFVVGNSSTDGIQVNSRLIEAGDWTGPGAARFILRHPEVEVAVLEAARGGILRRGLGVQKCTGALVTNISKDHLGEYGIHSLEEMANTKAVVYGAVHDRGGKVINMDDPLMAPLAQVGQGEQILFSLGAPEGPLAEHLQAGGRAVFCQDDAIHIAERGTSRRLVDVCDIAIAHGGTARYNVSNAMGAIGLGLAIGLDDDAMVKALERFGTAWEDNPGRGHVFSHNGVKICLDFGHNPRGVAAALRMVAGLRGPQGRLSVSVCQAGDRSEADIAEMCEAIAKVMPDVVRVRALPEVYRRGRTTAEMQAIFRHHLIAMGLSHSAIIENDDAVEALEQALNWAKPGDVVAHLVHVERDAVKGYLRAVGALDQ